MYKSKKGTDVHPISHIVIKARLACSKQATHIWGPPRLVQRGKSKQQIACSERQSDIRWQQELRLRRQKEN